MAFGQQLGPPASARQVQELLGLLHDAGHIDFRDARGPMGFTQRQAGGRFTRDEAAAFIERLQEGGGHHSGPQDSRPREGGPRDGGPSSRRYGGRPPGGLLRSAGPGQSVPAAKASAELAEMRLSAQEQLLRHLPAQQLAAELRRRGWSVTEP